MPFIDPDEAGGFKDPDEVTKQPERPSLSRLYKGSMEAIRSIGQGMGAGLLQGFLSSTGPGPGTRQMLGMGPDVLPQQIGQALSYTPSTEEGRAVVDIVSAPGRIYSDVAKGAGEMASEATGSPMVGEMVEKGIKVAPYGIGRLPGAGVSPAVEAAKKAGFKLTPTEPGAGGPISRTLTGLSGEARLQRLISQKNQEIVNAKIAEDLGLPKGVQITSEALQTIRGQAGKAYEAVKKTGTIVGDGKYLNDLVKIRNDFAAGAMDFPGVVNKEILGTLKGIAQEKFGADAAVSTIKGLRSKANKAFRAGDNSEGAAYKAMANAMESQLERHLVRSGQPANLIENYRAARTLIAKTHDAENALNAVSGNIRAVAYGRDAAKGAPMSGGAQEVGQAAAAFPTSFRPAGSYMGTGASAGDIAMALGNKIATGGGLGTDVLSLGARPAARSLLASDFGQYLMGRPIAPRGILPTGLAPGLLSPEEKRGLLSGF